MCTISDDVGEIREEDPKQNCEPASCEPRSLRCLKCQSTDNVLRIRSDEILCSHCFLSRATHKFRSEFGKSRLIRDKEKVLVAYSGGMASAVMLHLIQEGSSKRAQKKLRFLPSLVCIDEGFRLDTAQRRSGMDKVIKQMQSTGLPYYVYCIEQAVEMEDDSPLLDSNQFSQHSFDLYWQKLQTKASGRLLSLIESAKTTTAKESLLYILKKQLLVRAARALNYGKVLIGDLASGLAVRIISHITQGRGIELPYEVSFADARSDDITFVRPMREFSLLEVENYISLNHIEPAFAECVQQEDTDLNSIDSLAKKFVFYLQSQHENTIPIICRTAEKLAVSDAVPNSSSSRCRLCQAALKVTSCPPMDACNMNVEGCSEIELINRSALHCTDADCVTQGLEQCLLNAAQSRVLCSEPSISHTEADHQKSAKPTDDTLPSHLCYACRRLAREMNDTTCLPLSDDYNSPSSQNRVWMQETIADYLIKDADLPESV